MNKKILSISILVTSILAISLTANSAIAQTVVPPIMKVSYPVVELGLM